MSGVVLRLCCLRWEPMIQVNLTGGSIMSALPFPFLGVFNVSSVRIATVKFYETSSGDHGGRHGGTASID